jgi:hypothetical protein
MGQVVGNLSAVVQRVSTFHGTAVREGKGLQGFAGFAAAAGRVGGCANLFHTWYGNLHSRQKALPVFPAKLRAV